MNDLIRTNPAPDLKVPRNKKAKTDSQRRASGGQASTSIKRPIFLALQGGGARGIIHIGALTAVNELNLEIKGVAGTSAGSIVAALIAAGYSGSDLFDLDIETKKNLFSSLPAEVGASKPSDLFSKSGWRWVKAIQIATRLKLPVPIWVFGALSIGVYGYLSYLVSALNVWVGLALNLAAAGVVGFGIMRIVNGLTTLDRVRKVIDFAVKRKRGIQTKLDAHGNPEMVSFQDLEDAGGIPLKIVATNTRHECVEVFSKDTTPTVAIADAVAASVCLPFIFKPWEFKFLRSGSAEPIKGQFLDGGFVSNLPAWPFDEERSLEPGVPTVALSIVSASAESKHWASSIINTIVNGTAEIDTRAVGRLAKIPLKTELGMLDFDAAYNDLYVNVAYARQTTMRHLSTELIDTPTALRSTVSAIQADVLELIEYFRVPLHQESDVNSKIRVAIATVRDGRSKSMAMVYTAGHGYRHLSDVALPLTHPAGKTWALGKLKVFQRGRYELAPHLPNPEWMFCVPLFSASQLSSAIKPCVIVIELDIAFANHSEDGRQHFKDLVACVGSIVSRYNRKNGLAEYVQGTNVCL